MNKKKTTIILVIIFAIILIGLVLFLVVRNIQLENAFSNQSQELLSVEQTQTPISTPQIIATVSSVDTTPSPISSLTQTATKSIDQLVLNALSEKMSQDSSNLEYSISKKSEKSAYGFVNVKGEMSGGWFVAVEDGESWKVIADGNGTIDCVILDQYNVPNTVVGECYDSATESSKTR